MRRKKSAVMQLHAAVGQRPAYAEEVGPHAPVLEERHSRRHAWRSACPPILTPEALEITCAFLRACVLQARKAGVVDALTRLLGSTGESPDPAVWQYR